MTLSYAAPTLASPCPSWPAWDYFRTHYVSSDGRVVDASTPRQVTVSEGQAYALFFALVANDQHAFERLLNWTQNNLSQGDLSRTLPAWLWGRGDDGTWKVLDSNPASDADVWIAYVLFEAARLWREPKYKQLAHALAARIVQEEVATVPGLGATLLPAPVGFVDQQTFRLNASYLPIQAFRALHRHTGHDVWGDVVSSSRKIIVGSAPRGFAADWVEYRADTGFISDRSTKGVGGYNAIRVYLWTGMLADKDPLKRLLANHLAPMVTRSAQRDAVVEEIDTQSLIEKGSGGHGFSAALLPLLVHHRQTDALTHHRSVAAAHVAKNNQSYYNDALSLFGLGWIEQRYRFEANGFLKVPWSSSCARAR